MLPRDFSSLFSILFCKTVPGVGGTLRGVFKDKPSKRRGWGQGGDENKLSAAPYKSACEPEKIHHCPLRGQGDLYWYLHPTSPSEGTDIYFLFLHAVQKRGPDKSCKGLGSLHRDRPLSLHIGQYLCRSKEKQNCLHLDDLGLALVWWEDIFYAIKRI